MKHTLEELLRFDDITHIKTSLSPIVTLLEHLLRGGLA